VKEFFADIQEIKFAYLFGSTVEGKETALSDVDVAVYLEEDANTVEKQLQIHHTLAKRLKKDVDAEMVIKHANLERPESYHEFGRAQDSSASLRL